MIKRDLTADLLHKIAERFQFHSKNIYGSPSSENNSPLYAHLALAASNDPEILALVADTDFATQLSNLLFGAVQYLLLGGTQSSLASFYPNLSDAPQPISEAYPHFRAFCLEHAESIKTFVESQRVQTNEVGRCAGLLPAFNLVAQRGLNKPLALVEIGASAGLLLLWDYYGYHYESLGRLGNETATVQLDCRLIGEQVPPIPQVFPVIGERIGLELNPINVHDSEAVRWLEALIWPEHADRRKLLKAALAVAQEKPLRMIGGNAADSLAEILGKISSEQTLCIFHSYTFAQMPIAIRESIEAQLLEHAKQRDFFCVSQEWLAGWEKPRLELFSYQHGKMQAELLAYAESHGRWIEWLA